MSAHSKGPWHASQTYPCAIYADGEVLIGLCDGLDGLAKRYANARLIAAAPDLLEALRELRGYADRVATGADAGAVEEYIAQADAAIAKATA